MLVNISFYLKRTAKVWFENHEALIGSWKACKKKKMHALFGKSTGMKAVTKKELESRTQTSLES